MKSNEHNYEYCGLSIVIRNGHGVLRCRNKMLKELTGLPHDQIKSNLEAFVDNHRRELLTGVQLDPNVSKGLMQLPVAFAQEILNKLEGCEKKWQQPAYVKFGIMGIVSEGKPGKPNYQIESDDEKEKLAFRYGHTEFDVSEFKFKNITERLSSSDIKKIWLME